MDENNNIFETGNADVNNDVQTENIENTGEVQPETIENTNEVQPEAMPAQEDNVYRFQNTEAIQRNERKAAKQQKEKKGGSVVGKAILGGVLFGVIAAFCFFGLTTFFDVLTRDNTTIEETDTVKDTDINTGNSVAIVSGNAVTAVDVSGVVEQVMPSIVAITEKGTATSYFGQTYPTESAGSGFIVKQLEDQLLVVTNAHVVSNGDEITVQFIDGETADATVKGSSESNDLAVLTVDLKDLKDSTKSKIKTAVLGSSDDTKVGQMVIAIGNALGYGQSVTVGYVSAKDREVTFNNNETGESATQILMQTDAAINPGNSGGALINAKGEVIGINSSKMFSYASTDVEGMGYAIPMSDAVGIINELMDRQVLKDEERGYLGITGRNIDSSLHESYGIPEGVYVASVSDTGAAYKAGIKRGDIIIGINGRTVKTITEVQEIVNNTKSGTSIEVTILRSDDGDYKEKKVEVTLKSKETLEGLEEESTTPQNNYNYNNEQDSQVIPWGGSIY